MASHGNNSTYPGQGKRTSFGAFSGANASMFLDKAKPGIRGSTPDSEALASSDDEQDQYHRLHTITSSSYAPKPARRGSWLTEVQQPPPQRKSSLTGCGQFSSSSPHPASSSGDQTSWSVNQPSGGRGHSSSTSFPWGSAIWNNDSQKGPPLRLTEVLPSPTSTIPPNGLYSEDPLLSPPIGRENATESSIPFAIPLHPTLKTYRSQSYSVGQLDPEMTNGLPTNYGGPLFNGRPRTGSSYAGLQHRPSRPSMLGELSRDALGQLREVEDDESSNGSESGGHLSTAQARTIEQLAMENAILRQAAADQIEGNNIRNRTLTATSNTSGRNTFHGNQRIRGSVPEEADYALYDPEDTNTSQLYDSEGYSAAGIPENRTLESVKKGHWQSSLGFGGVGEPPQSRRHSFADVPTRQTSISSTGETQNGFGPTENGVRAGGRLGSPAGYGDGLVRPSQGEGSECTQFRLRQVQEIILELEHLHDRNFAASYFAGMDASLRNADVHRPCMSSTTLHQAYTMHVPYGRSQHNGHSQPRPNQLLYVVTFKAYRAEVFYVQEGTGLQVKPGDLVIVEADRGTDLGTVAQENVPWNRAKEMKEHYIEEHYRWLMMFSRHGQNRTNSTLNPNDPGPPSNGAQTSAVGGMGGPNAQAGVQDIPNQELKPKMIKRLAQAHEIQTLKDKEGNEAKAKRVCQQKVVEHRLNMEILDAEFQMDWKKLTFYYFADAYINFNPLVTDLFKIYKTRIWMSAINPASFMTPSTGSQLPSTLDPGHFIQGSETYSDRRAEKHNPGFSVAGSSQVAPGVFDRIWDPNRDPSTALSIHFPQIYAPPLHSQDLDNHQHDPFSIDYHQGGQQAIPLQPRCSPSGYNVPELDHSAYTVPSANSDVGSRKPCVLGNEWSHAFQGLSLGS